MTLTQVTNRELFGNLLKIYFVHFTLVFLVGLWCIVVLFLTFQSVNFGKISAAVNPYSLYVCTALFLLPYLATLLYYLMDLHYLLDELSMRGVIREPGRRKGTV